MAIEARTNVEVFQLVRGERERERERERGREGEREGERGREGERDRGRGRERILSNTQIAELKGDYLQTVDTSELPSNLSQLAGNAILLAYKFLGTLPLSPLLSLLLYNYSFFSAQNQQADISWNCE